MVMCVLFVVWLLVMWRLIEVCVVIVDEWCLILYVDEWCLILCDGVCDVDGDVWWCVCGVCGVMFGVLCVCVWVCVMVGGDEGWGR